MKKKFLALTACALVVATTVTFAACSSSNFDASLESYKMNILDLSAAPAGVSAEHEYMFTNNIVDTPDKEVIVAKKPQSYLGHPDNVLLDNGDIITAYPVGHGKGETLLARSTDDGITWNQITGMPESFKLTEETPTIYKLDFTGARAGDQKLIIASARPGWNKVKGEGFDVTVSNSGKEVDGEWQTDGAVWQPHKNYFSEHGEAGHVEKDGVFEAIVAMASLTQLKDASGNLENRWMGIFHDYDYNVYKTMLTFDADDNMKWSYPARVISDEYRDMEKDLAFCEPETLRSPDGKELAMIFRAQTKISNSYVIFSTDEGVTWTGPKALSRELTGERHKAEYDPLTGKLLITYRAINWKLGQEHEKNAWYSRGWLTWVGDYDDLKKGNAGTGDYVLKMAHTYSGEDTDISEYAHADTGYAGLTIDNSGLAVMASYGKFSPFGHATLSDKTYIVAKRFRLNDINAHFGLTAFPTR